MKRLFWCVLIGLLLVAIVAILPGCGQEKAAYRIATDATWPPFESVNEQTMAIEGFDIDLMTAIADKENLDIEFVNVAFDPLLAGVAQCTYDAAISSITILPERAESMLFSDPYFEAGQIVTVRKDNTDIASKDDLGGKEVGAQIGTTGSFEVQKIAGATLKTYDDIGLAFQDLMNGQIDAVVADNPLALLYVSENSSKLKTVGEVFTDEFYGIAVCKTNTELLAKINDGLAKVKAEGLIQELVDKWWPTS
jgi:polar amino acid transport system substrate-binding protein